jgi:hypothetical protein
MLDEFSPAGISIAKIPLRRRDLRHNVKTVQNLGVLLIDLVAADHKSGMEWRAVA